MLSTFLISVQVQWKNAEIVNDLSRLGIERSKFGDVPNSGRFKYRKTHQFGGTYILFPTGRSDMRYYVFVGTGSYDLEMCAASKVDGKIKNLWFLRLSESKRPFFYPNAGTLWRFACRGYRPIGPIPAAARKDFEAIQGLAVYRLVGGPIAPFHWYVNDAANESETHGDWALKDDDWKALPITAMPYPISEEEKRWIEFYKPIRPEQP